MASRPVLGGESEDCRARESVSSFPAQERLLGDRLYFWSRRRTQRRRGRRRRRERWFSHFSRSRDEKLASRRVCRELCTMVNTGALCRRVLRITPFECRVIEEQLDCFFLLSSCFASLHFELAYQGRSLNMRDLNPFYASSNTLPSSCLFSFSRDAFLFFLETRA